MHRFCRRPLAALSQKHKMKALNALADLKTQEDECDRKLGNEYGRLRFASQQIAASHVRFGSKADIGARPINVRFTPDTVRVP